MLTACMHAGGAGYFTFSLSNDSSKPISNSRNSTPSSLSLSRSSRSRVSLQSTSSASVLLACHTCSQWRHCFIRMQCTCYKRVQSAHPNCCRTKPENRNPRTGDMFSFLKSGMTVTVDARKYSPSWASISIPPPFAPLLVTSLVDGHGRCCLTYLGYSIPQWWPRCRHHHRALHLVTVSFALKEHWLGPIKKSHA
jgi:hypothetical protein